MKILMFGRGVITTIYGWAFSGAGHEVTYLVRPGKSASLGGKLSIDMLDGRKNPKGESRSESFNISCVENLDGLADFDLVVVGVRQDQMRAAAQQLQAASRPRKGILFFNNCWEDPYSLSALFAPSEVIWGFPMAGGGFEGDKTLKSAITAKVHLAMGGKENAALQAACMELFSSAGLKVELRPDFRAWQWLHFSVNASMIAQAMTLNGGAEELLSSRKALSNASLIVREAVQVVYAKGIDPTAEKGEATLATLPAFFAGVMVKRMARSNPVTKRLMTINAKPRDLAQYPLRLIEEARRLGVSCPRLFAAEAKIREIAGAN
jgi:2-dehydropantoate 2-reductase